MEGEIVDINAIKRTAVESSNIDEIGYDKASSTLIVKFHHGGIYSYDSVPEKIYKDFLASQSKGKFFISNVKGRYDFRKV